MVDHAVLIAAADLLPGITSRMSHEAREITGFTDTEALRALEIITTRRPGLVMLERKFSGTPRGAALINRIKADPSLTATRIDIVSAEGHAAAEPADASRAPSAGSAAATASHAGSGSSSMPSAPPQHDVADAAASAAAAQGPVPTLDFRGTRRAPRYAMPETCEMLVDGNRATLVDLSTLGAQILIPTVLKPNQRVRISLGDESATLRFSATVVWAAFEIPKGKSPRYRAGLDFIEPDVRGVDGYIQRHGASAPNR